jgi:hypothetical protein
MSDGFGNEGPWIGQTLLVVWSPGIEAARPKRQTATSARRVIYIIISMIGCQVFLKQMERQTNMQNRCWVLRRSIKPDDGRCSLS